MKLTKSTLENIGAGVKRATSIITPVRILRELLTLPLSKRSIPWI